ncbi:hypothetical protein POM88_029868 [Heracleum sosnowskyi]|uniref:Uncharacterized protein n=1 Tax=Heracleum sosnowskyi TaxID=360622 RepID=A0AAD8HXC2_9APIA|nr:hypothetical protein POM88_029868 [Heracleum sosnowskyi]
MLNTEWAWALFLVLDCVDLYISNTYHTKKSRVLGRVPSTTYRYATGPIHFMRNLPKLLLNDCAQSNNPVHLIHTLSSTQLSPENNQFSSTPSLNICMSDCLLDEVEGSNMSFHEKGFWMAKSGGHLDAEALFGSSPTTESKRPHHWFADASEQELFPSKKQAVESPNSKFTSEIPTGSLPWDSGTGFHSSPNQFIDRLFGSETNKSIGFSEGYISPIGTENSNNQSPVSLSMSYGIEPPNSCLSFGGIPKVKVDQVKDSNNIVEESFERSSTCSEQVYNRMNETSFITIGQAFDKDEPISSLGQAYKGETDIRSIDLVFGKDDDNSMGPIDDSFDKFKCQMHQLKRH